jgi:hypothetical protein
LTKVYADYATKYYFVFSQCGAGEEVGRKREGEDGQGSGGERHVQGQSVSIADPDSDPVGPHFCGVDWIRFRNNQSSVNMQNSKKYQIRTFLT